MGFESVRLQTTDGFDLEAARRWLEQQPWAFLDPHSDLHLHVSATREAAAAALQARLEDPSRFPLGVVVELHTDGVLLEARTDLATLARGRQFVERITARGTWTMRQDWLDFDRPLSIEELFRW